MQTEKKPDQKITYDMMLFVVNVRKRQICRDRKIRSCLRLGVEVGKPATKYEGNFGGGDKS